MGKQILVGHVEMSLPKLGAASNKSERLVQYVGVLLTRLHCAHHSHMPDTDAVIVIQG
jgi:hypothetical protein